MPFKSQAQARFLFARHPKIAKEFASKTKSIKALPEHMSFRGSKKQKRNLSRGYK